jgi:hypothetical protein
VVHSDVVGEVGSKAVPLEVTDDEYLWGHILRPCEERIQ